MHLMLKFEAVRGFGHDERMDLVFIDTDNGKVIELGFEAVNLVMTEREPTWGEMDSVGKTLGKAQPGMVSKKDADELQGKLEASIRAGRGLHAELVEQNEKISALERQVLKLQNDQNKYNQAEIVSEALDAYIVSQANAQEFERFEDAKKVYHRITGKKWVDDGLDDDNEG